MVRSLRNDFVLENDGLFCIISRFMYTHRRDVNPIAPPKPVKERVPGGTVRHPHAYDGVLPGDG